MKITDLGIAKFCIFHDHFLKNDTLSCTPRYASLETITKNESSFQSDVWSLGLVIFEIFTNEKGN